MSIEVGGKKPVTTTVKTIAGKIADWANKRGHTVETGLKSAAVMFSVGDATVPKSAKGKAQIMFTVFGKTPTTVEIWLNAFSMKRGSEPKATNKILPKAKWGKVTQNKRAGATFTPKDGHIPTDAELDHIYTECRTNLPVRKKAGKARATRKTKTAKKAKTTNQPPEKAKVKASGKAVKGAKLRKGQKQHKKLQKQAA